jgi:ATP-dependent DNA helicase RecG
VIADLGPWDPVDRLKGIGPKLTASLAGFEIHRVVDLLLHLPYRYEDRTLVVPLDEPLAADRWVLVRGRVRGVTGRRAARRRMRIVTGVLDDGRGSLPVVWFNQPWIEDRLRAAGDVSLYGPIRRNRRGMLELVTPEVNDAADGGDERIAPVYRSLGTIGGRRLRGLIEQCLPQIEACVDPLPAWLRAELELPEMTTALRQLHARCAQPLPHTGSPAVGVRRAARVRLWTRRRPCAPQSTEGAAVPAVIAARDAGRATRSVRADGRPAARGG